MMMKKQRKISIIRLLMVSSQVLLALFLGYWLYTQFTDQKRLLTEGLERGLRQSEQQVIDTMLAANLINPILKDMGNFPVFMYDSIKIDSNKSIWKCKSAPDSVQQIVMHFIGNDGDLSKLTNLPNIQKFDISVADRSPDPDSIKITIRTQQDTCNQLLVKSVRLFINSAEKYTTDEGWMSSLLYSNPDTLLLKKLFRNFLGNDYEGFTVKWLPITPAKAGGKKPPGIYLVSRLFEISYVVTINRYQVYLLKAIIPQIVFAILLLLITTMAFRMAYISLKNQRKLLTLKNDFIANISHELKTPVSTVKVALEALLDFNMKKDTKLTKEYLEMAYSEMNRLDLLVSQVLNNSVLEEGNKFVFPEKINLTALVNEVLHSMQSRFDNLGAEVRFQPENDAVTVNADKLHIHGVLVNLIDNSLKYCRVEPRISIHLTREAKTTKLTVADNGIGIPDEYLDKVFDKFFRVPTGGTHNVKGYGLGLNYAALVMQHHGGTISVTNLEEGGCRFTLSFPNIEP